MVDTVLVYIEKNDQYLLIYRNKKKNDINEGKWIGVGGHIEKGETPIDAMIREVKEETNLDVLSYVKNGIVHFKNEDFSETMHLFTVTKFEGEIGNCDEGELRFINKKDMNKLQMWEGDKIFLKYLEDKEPYFELVLEYKGEKLLSSKRIK